MVSGADFYGEPSVTELLVAVLEWLERDVAATADGAGRFQARVAAGVLAMAVRELQLGDDHRRRHARRLEALGVADDHELVALIRSGAADARQSEVVDALRADVLDRLAVVDPGYPQSGQAPASSR